MTFLWFSVTILFYSINVKTQSDLRIYVNQIPEIVLHEHIFYN